VDRGRSREAGGTGLGLAIVKHVLERHQAVLQIDSEPGLGLDLQRRVSGAPGSVVKVAALEFVAAIEHAEQLQLARFLVRHDLDAALELEGAGGHDQAGRFIDARLLRAAGRPAARVAGGARLHDPYRDGMRFAGKQLDAGGERAFSFAQCPAHVAQGVARCPWSGRRSAGRRRYARPPSAAA
jgi:hypothetical protein